MVGALVVRNGRLVGQGFHTYSGRKHAEIIALESAGLRARGATLYVTLEPCCHHGRTGPCSDAIIAAGVKRVVAAMRDPNPLVRGRGFRRLRSAGIIVDVGASEKEAARINQAYSKWIVTRRPFVTLKSAASLDGRIAARAESSTWLTSRESLAEVHRIRHSADALITGVGTVLADNPRMTDRSGLPRRVPLLRVILDSRLRLPLRSKLVKDAHEDVLVYTALPTNSRRARALQRAGVEVERVPARSGRVKLSVVLRALGQRGILHALVESGAELNGAFFAERLVDRFILFVAPCILGETAVPLARFGNSSRRRGANLPPMQVASVRQFGPDICIEGHPGDVHRNR
jgi:diaminohydroxyphosphoribosylaminopyrimidine deaminase/5-amino-6-(5-phosphoribosylamino)uracil reductase